MPNTLDATPPAPSAPPMGGGGILPALPSTTGNPSLDAYTQASLGALNAGVDYTQTPTYKTLLSMLGPGPNGGLSPALMNQYTAGSSLIGQKTAGNVALAKSGAQGRGLANSSIEAQGVENAEFQGGMEDTALLSSLYGEQSTNTRTLAQDVFSGSDQELSHLLSIYDSAGTSAANMQMYSSGLQEALAAASAAAQAQMMAGIAGGVGSLAGGATYAALA